MLPCKLTLFRCYTDDDGNEAVSNQEVYGQAETPPSAGAKFAMMTNEEKPQEVKTGFVSCVEWFGAPVIYPGRKASQNTGYPSCFFQTDSSHYRWDFLRPEGENAAGNVSE